MNTRDLNAPRPTQAPWSLTEAIKHLAPHTHAPDPDSLIIELLEANTPSGWNYQTIPDNEDLVICAIAVSETLTYAFNAARGILTVTQSSTGTEIVLEKVDLSSGLTAPEIASIIAAHIITLASPTFAIRSVHPLDQA